MSSRPQMSRYREATTWYLEGPFDRRRVSRRLSRWGETSEQGTPSSWMTIWKVWISDGWMSQQIWGNHGDPDVHSIALFPKATNGLMRTHPRRDFSHHSSFPSFWSSQLFNFSKYQRVSPRIRDSALKMLCPAAPSKPSTYLSLEHFAIHRRQIPSLFGAFGGPLFAGYCISDRHDPNVCRKHMSSRFQGWFPRWTSWRQQHWASKDSIQLLELLEIGLCMLCHPRLSRWTG